MSNKHSLKFCGVLVLLVTLCQLLHYSKGDEEQLTCECECIYDVYRATGQQSSCPGNPVAQRPTAPPSYKERIELDLDIADCSEHDEDSYSFIYPPCDLMDVPCQIERNCCLGVLGEDSFTLTCSGGFRSRVTNILCDPDDCYLPTAKNCICTTSKPTNNQSQRGFAIGLGVGIGICVFVAALIALLVYCRLKGRGEGQGKAQGTLPKGTLPSTDANRQGDNEESAEIDSYIGDATMRAVANQAYSSSDVVITPGQSNQAYTSLNDPAINSHQYKSLKKPNQDLGSGDYADPEKYTEPPVLPQRNSNAIDDEEDDEDYVSQGTPEPATNNDDSRDDYTFLEPTAPSSDNFNSSAQSNPKEPPTPSSDYVSVDTQDHPNSKSPSSDYVSLDAPDHPSPISPSSDYVSVDAPDNDTEENDISSDYVDF